jgi:hypothetical protein
MAMDYSALVHRVRELVWEHVPAGSNVAVVSKGDPALILFDQRNGLHYPQTASGQYLGHHPDTGVAAVAHLESLRLRGAQYLVIPSIYAWFLDYYSDLRNHLNREGELVHRDDVCAIYSLARREVSSAGNRTAPERQLRDLVAAVLPPGSTIHALGWARAAFDGTTDYQLVELAVDIATGDAGAAALEAGLRGSRVDYLVVPAARSRATRARDPLTERLRATWPKIIDHKHVCTVFAVPTAAATAKR